MAKPLDHTHTHRTTDIDGLEPRLERLESKMKARNPGHNHPVEGVPGMEDGSGHPALDHDDGDSHPLSHADHPYVSASHRFTKQQPKATSKGQDVSDKGDQSFIDV